MKLVIDRNTWLRGIGTDRSYLLTKHGTQCCVGFYLEACGVKREDLEGVAGAHCLNLPKVLPDESKWLIEKGFYPDTWAPTARAVDLYSANDALLLSLGKPSFETEEERETYIKDVFAAQGVEVEFIN